MARCGLRFPIPAAQTMDQNPNLPPTLLYSHGLRRVPESTVFHQLQKRRRIATPGICEYSLATLCQQLGDEVRQGRDVPGLVEHVGGEDEAEGSEEFGV